MGCGFCKKDGHTIKTCTEEGADERRRQNAEKAGARRRVKAASEWEKYQMQEEEITLPSPKITPGCVNIIYSEDCSSVKGAILTAFPPRYLPYIVQSMNFRMTKKMVMSELATSEAVGRASSYRTFLSKANINPTKGRPATIRSQGGSGSRKVVKLCTRSRKRKRGLLPLFLQETDENEVHKFFSILLYASRQKVKEYRLLWSTLASEGIHPFVRRLMSRERFSLLYNCFQFEDDEVNHLESLLSDHLLKVWVPANCICVDETLVPFKGRGNPNHVFIMRKPHPHGTKYWSAVDFSGYYTGLSLFRRGQDKESPSDTVLKMCKGISKESLIVADSYFGGLKTMEKLSQEGHMCVMSCKQTQPSFLFKDYLIPKCQKDGDCSSVYGVLPDGRPFSANAFVSRGRKLLTLSSAFNTKRSTVTVEAFVQDETEEDQMESSICNEERPEVRNIYSSYMDFNDTGNAAVMALYPSFRKKHWSTSILMWTIMMLLGNNALRLYQSASGKIQLSRTEWVDAVKRILAGEVEEDTNSAKKLRSKHPCSEKIKGEKDLKCKSCVYMQASHIARTRFRCSICGPICKLCEKSRANHLNYANALVFQKRRYYQEGTKQYKRRKSDQAAIEKLIHL